MKKSVMNIMLVRNLPGSGIDSKAVSKNLLELLEINYKSLCISTPGVYFGGSYCLRRLERKKIMTEFLTGTVDGWVSVAAMPLLLQVTAATYSD